MIPVNEPLLGERENRYVMECLDTGWISSAGTFVDAFEKRWAAYCDRAHGIAVSNGTVALEIAVKGLGLDPGAEIILPSFTIISCVQAVLYAGCKPVLVDADPKTWCMDVDQIEAKITPRTRAIMPVHIFGHPVDMTRIMGLAGSHGLHVIEDAAEAHGAEINMAWREGGTDWRRCGSFGDLSAFSFFANKIVTTGEGGMVLTDQIDLAERLSSLRNLCFRPERRFLHTELGHNYRLTNVQAAIGVGQLENIENTLNHKRWMAKMYTEQFSDVPHLQLPVEMDWARNVYWMYGVIIEESSGMTASELAGRLAAEGVMTRPFFWPMHEQPALLERGLFEGEHYPVSENIARQGLYLPSGQALTEEQLGKVVHAVMKVVGEK